MYILTCHAPGECAGCGGDLIEGDDVAQIHMDDEELYGYHCCGRTLPDDDEECA